MSTQKNVGFAFLWFSLSALLTVLFIANKFWAYNSVNSMILSGCIAGAKWIIQIITGFLFLKEKKWAFVNRIGFVCFIGSTLLFLYNLLYFFSLPIGGFSQFVLSIGISVGVMILLYYKAVKKTGLSIRWFLFWLLCLGMAVFLQITLVF
jgi:multisubunit Na+/H+ antiporter MnhB subunit